MVRHYQCFNFLKIYFFLAVLGLYCGMQGCLATHTILVPRPGIELVSPELEARFLSLDHQGSPPSLLSDQLLKMKMSKSCLVR